MENLISVNQKTHESNTFETLQFVMIFIECVPEFEQLEVP